jgi:hypothetical protein
MGKGDQTSKDFLDLSNSFLPNNSKQIERLGLTYFTLEETVEISKRVKEITQKEEKAPKTPPEVIENFEPRFSFERELAQHRTGIIQELVDALKGGDFGSLGSHPNGENSLQRSEDLAKKIYNGISLLRDFFETQTKRNRDKLVKKIIEFGTPLEPMILNELGNDFNPALSPATLLGFINIECNGDKEILRQAELFLGKLSNYFMENIQSSLNANTSKFRECYKKLVRAKDDRLVQIASRDPGDKLAVDFSYVVRATKFETSRKDILKEIQTAFKKDKRKKTLLDPLKAHLYAQTKKHFGNWTKITEKYETDEN